MKNLLKLFLLFWAALCVPTVRGQDLSSLRKQAEKIVKAQNPSKKLLRKHEGEKEVTYIWGQDEKSDTIMLTLFYGASEQEAVARMKTILNRLSMGPGKKRSDIGDEAYSWKSESGSSGGVRFRRANVYIEVTASLAVIADDLAKSLDLQMVKK